MTQYAFEKTVKIKKNTYIHAYGTYTHADRVIREKFNFRNRYRKEISLRSICKLSYLFLNCKLYILKNKFRTNLNNNI